jgi:hypothetical protein
MCALSIEPTVALDALQRFLGRNGGLGALFSKDPTVMLTHFAFNTGDCLEALAVDLLALAGLDAGITMAELYGHSKKALIVTAVDLKTAGALYLDHTNEGQSMPVALALRASMALPPLYAPVRYKNMVLVDGGLLDNFPMAHFAETTAIGIRTAWYLSPMSMDDIFNYFTRIVNMLQLGHFAIQQRVSERYAYVNIDLGPVGSDDASIDIQTLVFKGYRAALQAFASGLTKDLVFERPTQYLSEQPQLPSYMKLL